MKEETFWIVRKRGLLSELEKYPSNPIKTSYELLWSEVRRSDRSNHTIQNTLRRILENYFKILGGLDLEPAYRNVCRQRKDDLQIALLVGTCRVALCA